MQTLNLFKGEKKMKHYIHKYTLGLTTKKRRKKQ